MYPVSFIKAHIFWEGHKIFTLLLSYVVPVKSKVKISQNFVAFSEYMNFTIADVLYGRPLFTKAENHQDERKKSWFFLYLAPASLNECLSLCFLTLKMTFYAVMHQSFYGNIHIQIYPKWTTRFHEFSIKVAEAKCKQKFLRAEYILWPAK